MTIAHSQKQVIDHRRKLQSQKSYNTKSGRLGSRYTGETIAQETKRPNIAYNVVGGGEEQTLLAFVKSRWPKL